MLTTLITLAADTGSNAPAWWMFSGQMIFNVIVGGAMFWLKRQTEGMDTLRSQVEDRDAEIRSAAERIVNERMGVMLQAIERIEKRLEAGEQRFAELNQHDHQSELQLAKEVHGLREYMFASCATKQSQEALAKQVAGLREDLIRIDSSKGAA